MITVNMYYPIRGNYIWVELYSDANAQKVNEFMRMWASMRGASTIQVIEESVKHYEGNASQFKGI